MQDTQKKETVKPAEQNQQQNQYFTVQNILGIVMLRWIWIVLSVIICLGISAIYYKSKTPVYSGYAKYLIKEESGNTAARSRYGAVQTAENLGLINATSGPQNELEIIKSSSVVDGVVKNLKLYVSYSKEGTFRSIPIYKYQPLTVDIDSLSLLNLMAPIRLEITKNGNSYDIKGNYTIVYKDDRPNVPKEIETSVSKLPSTLKTGVGTLSFNANPLMGVGLKDGEKLNVTIMPIESATAVYVAKLNAALTDKQSSIIGITFNDAIPERITDFLSQLIISYNTEANEDKNAVAMRTEAFINDRLEKINSELGATEGQLESFKRQNNVTDLKMNASAAFASQNEYQQKAADMQTQIELLNNVADYINRSQNHYQPMPVNIGIQDPTTNKLIDEYNSAVFQRTHLLRSTGEQSEMVTELADQIDMLVVSIRQAISSARRNLQTQHQNLSAQYAKYSQEIAETPSHERTLNEIGREQEVRSGLYLMLLQKREENSISLASTADKGRVIEKPSLGAKVSPKPMMIMLIGLILGLVIPIGLFILKQMLQFKIVSRDDVTKFTARPIIADIPVANNSAKLKADIVVKENSNSQMEEIFRSLRTNLQFMMQKDEKVILFTSSISGEGKTFVAGNLAMSFALLGKKVVLVGLDIRKPRLAELFGLRDRRIGITNLLCQDNPTKEDIESQIVPSGVSDNLQLLMAGTIPPNPAELIARKSLEIIFDNLKEMYDYIIIDTAPVGLVTDTLQIGRVANVSVYVTRCDYTPKNCLEGFKELEDKLPNISLVINGVDMSKKENRYHYGYGSYGKYGVYGKYGSYGSYGLYGKSHYGKKDDDSVKLK